MRTTIFIHLSFIVLCLLSPYNGYANTNSDIRAKVAEIYHSQIGVKEATGRNDGPQIKAYLRVSNLPEGHPWCAAFVAWCYKEAGVKAIVSAYSPSWFVKNRLTKTPKQGDLIGIYFKNLGRIAHVGFYDRTENSFVITVEGNTNDQGSREGNRVAKRRRLKTQIRAYADWITKK